MEKLKKCNTHRSSKAAMAETSPLRPPCPLILATQTPFYSAHQNALGFCETMQFAKKLVIRFLVAIYRKTYLFRSRHWTSYIESCLTLRSLARDSQDKLEAIPYHFSPTTTAFASNSRLANFPAFQLAGKAGLFTPDILLWANQRPLSSGKPQARFHETALEVYSGKYK